MRIELTKNGGGVVVVLSRRNLLTLLAKLDEPLSKRTICTDQLETEVCVKAEEDDVHYVDRCLGRLSPTTEATLSGL